MYPFLGGALLVFIAWKVVKRLRTNHDELHPSVVDRIFRADEDRKRAGDLVEMRATPPKPSVSDGPPTKALSRVWNDE